MIQGQGLRWPGIALAFPPERIAGLTAQLFPNPGSGAPQFRRDRLSMVETLR